MLLKRKGKSRSQDSGFRIQAKQDQGTLAGGWGNFGFYILDLRFWISDCPYPGRTAYCRLPAAYCLLPSALFGILGAAEVMRVFQSEFFDASQKYDELSALATCWL
jgi:hypothetical protein